MVELEHPLLLLQEQSSIFVVPSKSNLDPRNNSNIEYHNGTGLNNIMDGSNSNSNNNLLQQLWLRQQQQQQGSGGNNRMLSADIASSEGKGNSNGIFPSSAADPSMSDLGPNSIETMILNQQKQQQHQQQQHLFQQMMLGGGGGSSTQNNNNPNAVSSGNPLASMMMWNNTASSSQQLMQQQHQHQQQLMMRRMSNQGWGGSDVAAAATTDFGGNIQSTLSGLEDDLSPIGLGRQVTSSISGNTNIHQQPNRVASSSLFASSFSLSNNNNMSGNDLVTLMASNELLGGQSNHTNNAALASSLAATPSSFIRNNNPLLQKVGLVSSAAGNANFDSSVTPFVATSSSNDNKNDAFSADNDMLGPWSAHAAGLLGSMIQNNSSSKTNAEDDKKNNRKKPKDRPKRPLSAYNIFFKEERNRILESLPVNAAVSNEHNEASEDGSDRNKSSTSMASDMKPKTKRKRKRKGPAPHGKIGFESLAKLIGKRWQELEPTKMDVYKQKAQDDMQRYKTEMEAYKEKQKVIQEQQQQQNEDQHIQLQSDGVVNSSNNSRDMFDAAFLEPKPIVELGLGMFQQQQRSIGSHIGDMNDGGGGSSQLDLQQQLLQLQRQLQQQEQNASSSSPSSSNQGLWNQMTTRNAAFAEGKQMDAFDNMMMGGSLQLQQQQQQVWKKPRLEPSVFQFGNNSNNIGGGNQKM